MNKREFRMKDCALQVDAIEYLVFEKETCNDIMSYIKELESEIKDMFESDVCVSVGTDCELYIHYTDDNGDDDVIIVSPGEVIIRIEDDIDPNAYKIVLMSYDIFTALYANDKE